MSIEEKDGTENFISVSSDAPQVEDAPDATTVEESATEIDESEADQEDKTESPKNDGEDSTATHKKGVQKRINEVVKQREEAKREAESLRKQLEELKKPAKQEAEQGKEPQEADFESYEDYLNAVEQFDDKNASADADVSNKAKDGDKEQPQKFALTDNQKTALAVIQETLSSETLPADFEEVALAKDVEITGDMLEAIADCEKPWEIMYKLGKDKELASSIAGKTPIQQARAIAALELSAPKAKPKPVKTTNSPDPIEPVSGSDVMTKSLDQMSVSEYNTYMNKKERGLL